MFVTTLGRATEVVKSAGKVSVQRPSSCGLHDDKTYLCNLSSSMSTTLYL